MCACEPGFTCSRCADRWPLDLNPYHEDWREIAEQQRERDLGTVDFLEPFEGLR